METEHATLSPCLLPSKVKLSYPFQSPQAFTWETFTGNLNSPSLRQCFNFTVHSLHHWAGTEGKNGRKAMTEAEKRQRQLKSMKRKKLFLFLFLFFYIRKECACIRGLPGEQWVFVDSLSTKRKPFHTYHGHNSFIRAWREKRLYFVDTETYLRRRSLVCLFSGSAFTNQEHRH